MRRTLITLAFLAVSGLIAVGCGDSTLDPYAVSVSEVAASAAASGLSERSSDADRLVCPLTAAETSARAVPDTLVEEQRPRRIQVRLNVRDLGALLALDVSFHNPYRCHWTGDLFVEREDPTDRAHHIARGHQVTIRGGSTLSGTILVRRPLPVGPDSVDTDGIHVFSARAYKWNGGDQEPYWNCPTLTDGSRQPCLLAEEPGGELVYADEVSEASLDDVGADDDQRAALLSCDRLVEARPPIYSELDFTTSGGFVDVMTAWQNRTRRDWVGDLYVDVVLPGGGLYILRRDLRTHLAPGVGFCSLDRRRQPQRPGLYLVTSRALLREGGAFAEWMPDYTLTTEITAVCNQRGCERIRPEQRRSRTRLTGRSAIHLDSGFFSEFTGVTLRYAHRTFDITDHCRIRQYRSGAGFNHVEVHFDTFDLPIGPRTWGRYTIELHPMPVVPSDAKTRDRLWIFTNGAQWGRGTVAPKRLG